MSSSRKNLLFMLGLVVTVMTVFYPVLQHGFLYTWDDRWQILNAYTFNGLTWKNVNSIFSNFYMGQYSPLNQFFYTFTYEIFGVNSFVFHVVNLCWHIGCVLLTYIFIKQILLLIKEETNLSVEWIAFGVALLMGIHPVQVEAVSWLSASKVVIQAFFFLLGLIFYLSYLRKEKVKYYLLCLLSYLLAFLCKEQAVVFPFCLLLLDYVTKRDIQLRLLWMEKVPFFMLSLCFGLTTLASFSPAAKDMVIIGDTYSFIERLVFSGYSLTEYVTKLIFPIKLMYIYPFPISYNETLPFRFYIYPLMLLGVCILLWKSRKRRIVMFGSLFFIIQLLLMLHILPMPRFYIGADRYLYLACVGFFFLVVYFLCQWSGIFRKGGRTILMGLCCSVVLFFCMYSNHICKKWENDVSLKEEMGELIKSAVDKEGDNYI